MDRLVAPYFAAVVAWLETAAIGVEGRALYSLVMDRIGGDFFGVKLNPGHLIHLDEWMNSPIAAGSRHELQSAMALQVDIIPATGSPYFTTNMEDGIALLDERGRAELRERHPKVYARIEDRRAFMIQEVGIRLHDDVLPLSNLASYLPPFWLSPGRAMAMR